MAYYAYKNVRDLLPDHIIKAQGEDYEGTCDYDGDMWIAAADYIIELKAQVEAQQTSMRLALECMKDIKICLMTANEIPIGPICDTIWYSEHETLFDFIDAAIAALEELVK